MICVKARVRFLAPTEGGRRTPVYPGYRPDHMFGSNDGSGKLQGFVGAIHFDDCEFLPLGEVKLVTIRFLGNPVIEKFIYVGRKWQINEGPVKVGEGEIIARL